MRNFEMWYVYVLRQIDLPMGFVDGQGSRRYYVGITNNMKQRLHDHNTGKNKSTAGMKWEVAGYLHMPSRRHAAILEQWLKVGSSREKRERLINLFEAGEHSGLFVDAFASTAYNWYAKRSQKGKV